MGYIQDHLAPGESVVYRARTHRVTFFVPALCTILFISAVGYAVATERAGELVTPLSVLFAATVLSSIAAWVRYRTCELAITDRRVSARTRLVRLRAIQVFLSQVDSIRVKQGIIGRRLGYGRVVISSTRGAYASFRAIADPQAFRRHVREQIAAVRELVQDTDDLPPVFRWSPQGVD